MALDLHSLKQRRELSPRREPYWSAPLDSGLHLGFRKIGEEGERNGTWIARLHRPDTKAHTYSSLGVESNDFDYVKACKAAQQWAKEVETGADPANAPTVRQACEAYIEWLRSKKGDKSAYDGEVRFKRAVYEHPAIADVRLTRRAFRSDTIIKWRNGLAGTAANKNRMLVALRAALNHAWREGKVSGDVADAWRRVSRIAKTADGEDVEGRRELRLDLEQRRALVAELTGNVRDLVSFVCVTGCRPGEAAQLRVGNWSSTGKTIIFKRSKTKPRTIKAAPAPAEICERLSAGRPADAFMFTQDDGTPWYSTRWAKLVREAAARAKLPTETCLYTLRHSFISSQLDAGLPLSFVAKNTGTSATMIDKHYYHVGADDALVNKAADVAML